MEWLLYVKIYTRKYCFRIGPRLFFQVIAYVDDTKLN